jgi:hypothetical protein
VFQYLRHRCIHGPDFSVSNTPRSNTLMCMSWRAYSSKAVSVSPSTAHFDAMQGDIVMSISWVAPALMSMIGSYGRPRFLRPASETAGSRAACRECAREIGLHDWFECLDRFIGEQFEIAGQ